MLIVVMVNVGALGGKGFKVADLQTVQRIAPIQYRLSYRVVVIKILFTHVEKGGNLMLLYRKRSTVQYIRWPRGQFHKTFYDCNLPMSI